MRMLRLIENMTLGRNAVGYLTESLHGAGSPQAQRIQIGRQRQLAYKKRLAKILAGIELDDEADAVVEEWGATSPASSSSPNERKSNVFETKRRDTPLSANLGRVKRLSRLQSTAIA